MKQTNNLKRVLIMAGGTGGHVFPGLAVANALKASGVEVHWLGTEKGLEARVVPEQGIPIHYVSIAGLRGKGIKPLLAAPFRIARAIYQSSRVIKSTNPDVVIGLGGFVSGPGGVAGWLARRPLVIHEQNAKAGVTNRLLSRLSRRVLEGFPDAFAASDKVEVTGNPVRCEIENVPEPDQRFSKESGRLKLLVLGGSLGAKGLNELLPLALSRLDSANRPEVIHQAGERHLESTQKLYETMQIKADVKAFVKEMAQAYAWADVVICRAGALTIAELCAVGVGAVLVPFPYAVDDHQTINAQYMVKHDAALCIQQADLSAEKLAELIQGFQASPEKCLKMAQAARRLRRINVAERITHVLDELSTGPRGEKR